MADRKADDHEGCGPDHVASDEKGAKVHAATRAFRRFGADGIFACGALTENHGTPQSGKRDWFKFAWQRAIGFKLEGLVNKVYPDL